MIRSSRADIMSELEVSMPYGIDICEGYHPHPRHWLALAELVGVAQWGPDSGPALYPSRTQVLWFEKKFCKL